MRTATLLAVTLCAAATAFADFSYTSTRKTEGSPAAGAVPSATKYYYKGQKMMTDTRRHRDGHRFRRADHQPDPQIAEDVFRDEIQRYGPGPEAGRYRCQDRCQGDRPEENHQRLQRHRNRHDHGNGQPADEQGRYEDADGNRHVAVIGRAGRAGIEGILPEERRPFPVDRDGRRRSHGHAEGHGRCTAQNGHHGRRDAAADRSKPSRRAAARKPRRCRPAWRRRARRWKPWPSRADPRPRPLNRHSPAWARRRAADRCSKSPRNRAASPPAASPIPFLPSLPVFRRWNGNDDRRPSSSVEVQRRGVWLDQPGDVRHPPRLSPCRPRTADAPLRHRRHGRRAGPPDVGGNCMAARTRAPA